MYYVFSSGVDYIFFSGQFSTCRYWRNFLHESTNITVNLKFLYLGTTRFFFFFFDWRHEITEEKNPEKRRRAVVHLEKVSLSLSPTVWRIEQDEICYSAADHIFETVISFQFLVWIIILSVGFTLFTLSSKLKKVPPGPGFSSNWIPGKRWEYQRGEESGYEMNWRCILRRILSSAPGGLFMVELSLTCFLRNSALTILRRKETLLIFGPRDTSWHINTSRFLNVCFH